MCRLIVALASGLPVAFAVFLMGCNSMSQVSPSPSVPMVEPTPVIVPRRNLVPRELKLKLTLDDPADLKLKQGDRVRKGQVIGDRTSARKALEQQRQIIRLKLEHLKASTGASSRPVSYAVEQSKVRQAQVRVQQAREAIAQFKTNSPWTDYAWASLRSTRNRRRFYNWSSRFRMLRLSWGWLWLSFRLRGRISSRRLLAGILRCSSLC
jgi:multidrug efflux pump subunit AcrA (membrane-fusion protein)